MNKNKLNLIIDSLMFIALLTLAVTGFLISPVSFRLGFRYRTPLIVKTHDLASIIFILLVLIHLYLHVPWIKTMLWKKKE